MAIEAVCACGARQSAPDAWAGRELRCSTCGERYRVPGGAPAAQAGPRIDPTRSEIKPPRGGAGPVLAVLAGLVVLGGLSALAKQTFARREKSAFLPSPRESGEERRRSNVEGFSVEPIVPGSDEARVRETLVALVAAHARGDGEGFTALFHYPRLVAEIEAVTPLKHLRTKADEEAFLKGIGIGMAQTVRKQAGTPMQWKAVEVARVRFHASRPEAEAFGQLRMGFGRARFRFWLIKDGSGWKVFDYEPIQEGMRATDHMAAAAAASFDPAGSERTRRATETTVRALQEMSSGEAEKALATLRAVRASGPSPLTLNQVDVMEGTILTATGRPKEALAILDGALARRKDLPLAHHQRGQALFALGEHEEAVRAEEEYVGLTGDDADALVTIGRALEALGRPDEALAALKRGVACDDEEWACRYHLARMMTARKDLSGVLPLFRDACRRAPPGERAFESSAAILQEARAWEVLLTLAHDAASRTHEALALRHLGRPADAEKALREGIRKDGPDAYRRELIRALAAQGKDTEAGEAAVDLEKAEPDAEDPAYYRAIVHAAAKREADALRELGIYLGLAPEQHAEVEAEPAFEALRKTPGFAAALAAAKEKRLYEEAAEEKEEADDWAAVLELSKKRLERVRDDGDAESRAGRALRQLKRPAEAEAPLRRAIQRLGEPRAPFARHELGLVLAELGRSDEALGIAEALVKDAKAFGLHLRAVALARAKRDDEAAKALGELLEAFKGYAGSVEEDPAFEALRKRPDVAEWIRKAKPARGK